MIHPNTKIKTYDDLNITLPLDRSEVVFTNGCFDILHYGHLKYLYRAKSLGKILVVAVNTDDTISRLKGNNRPINKLDVRMFQLACLEFVDYVVDFAMDTPFTIIQALRPGILVKGGDYEIKDIIGHDIVANTITIPFIPGYSTTDLINKFQT